MRTGHIVSIVIGIILVFVLFSFYAKEEVVIEPIIEPTILKSDPQIQIIGQSVEGRDITSHTFGDGDTLLTFVGGVHGGYEWNSVLLSYEFIDYLKANPTTIPSNIKVAIIPSANPDGLYAVTGKNERFLASDIPLNPGPTGTGRFNANNVDLNRNFDCKWKSESMWRGNVVSAGTKAFSEPEAIAIRDYVLAENPEAVIFWHSQANAVYASECEEGVLPKTLALMQTYADATEYAAVPVFDAYEVTGDAEGWLASIGIPAITVELKNHTDTEWERNLKGIQAVFEKYGQ